MIITIFGTRQMFNTVDWWKALWKAPGVIRIWLGSLVFRCEFRIDICGGILTNYLASCTEGKHVNVVKTQRKRSPDSKGDSRTPCWSQTYLSQKAFSSVGGSFSLKRHKNNFQFQHKQLLLDLLTPRSPDADHHFTLCFSPRHLGRCTLH